jgi:hypothetical protein
MKDIQRYEDAREAMKWLQFLKYNISDDSYGFADCIDSDEMEGGIFSIRENGKIRWVSGADLITFAKERGFEVQL